MFNEITTNKNSLSQKYFCNNHCMANPCFHMATCHWLAHVAKCIPIFSKVCSPFHSKFPNLPSINIRVNKMIRLFFPTFIKKIKDFSVKTYKTHWQTFHVPNRTFHEKTVFENNSKTKTLKILYILTSFFFIFSITKQTQ